MTAWRRSRPGLRHRLGAEPDACSVRRGRGGPGVHCEERRCETRPPDGMLAARLGKRSDVTLLVKFVAKVSGDVTKRNLTIAIPAALTTQVALTLDQRRGCGVSEAQSPAAVPPTRTKRGSKQSSVRANALTCVGLTGEARRGSRPTVFCQNTALATVGGGVVSVRCVLDYQVAQGELRHCASSCRRASVCSASRVMRFAPGRSRKRTARKTSSWSCSGALRRLIGSPSKPKRISMPASNRQRRDATCAGREAGIRPCRFAQLLRSDAFHRDSQGDATGGRRGVRAGGGADSRRAVQRLPLPQAGVRAACAR